ncbi:sodium:proton antiporter [Formosa algae]|uniref:Na+/H+ antiporter NhaD/arsenite permease-like protein n=1 Tax=Formosa algae TaxID=225843 RepID=A0A9X0YK60_9FLAO|nr:sodium:proton antiporter [Formosa algae]MBP1840585.1 Na+/H+ antiporter NhaD/arsenite permease-like protein [Formosa algae]MDQ0336002.1 Na+/H+ antiporter NhaD/arsenite permease-like protein [Formosa algae]OEI81106.1 sodium:proton antiporter [Formosa algae]PNW29123.1 sodium:proton antiporter [Formosa algae]
MLLLLNGTELVQQIPLWPSIPFFIILLAIAVGPLIAEEWWENNRNKFIVSIILSVPTIYYLVTMGLTEHLKHQILGDYFPFIVLLTSLFVITGGIHLSGDIKAKPWVNTLFLGIGYLLASFMGTTGAAMLLIRPVISINHQRKYNVHTILFFIAAVANCGGLLTPLGDPPLLMLYLRGASFTWFFSLIPEWAFTGALLLIIYYIVDTKYYKKEPKSNLEADAREIEPIRITGALNFVYLLGVILSVAFINHDVIPQMAKEDAPFWLKYLREFILLTLTAIAFFSTPEKTRAKNKFSWGPIVEVAVVFIGIFITMTPTLIFLRQHAPDMGLTEAWQFYYATGILSAFLDNTPTAVAFHSVASSIPVADGIPIVANVAEKILSAIATSAVFFGALTYIGNGPNFMVKSIAEDHGIKMPSFFGYMIKFSLIILLPIYILTQLLFM